MLCAGLPALLLLSIMCVFASGDTHGGQKDDASEDVQIQKELRGDDELTTITRTTDDHHGHKMKLVERIVQHKDGAHHADHHSPTQAELKQEAGKAVHESQPVMIVTDIGEAGGRHHMQEHHANPMMLLGEEVIHQMEDIIEHQQHPGAAGHGHHQGGHQDQANMQHSGKQQNDPRKKDHSSQHEPQDKQKQNDARPQPKQNAAPQQQSQAPAAPPSTQASAPPSVLKPPPSEDVHRTTTTSAGGPSDTVDEATSRSRVMEVMLRTICVAALLLGAILLCKFVYMLVAPQPKSVIYSANAYRGRRGWNDQIELGFVDPLDPR